MKEKKKENIHEHDFEKTCFVVMPIADMEGYDRGHFDRVYMHLIKPACLKAGYKPVRADDVDKSNYIVVDIMNHIVKSDMVLCDISGRNPNVMFELGFRQAFNLPTVLIKDDKTKNIFDIQGLRHIPYDSSLRIDGVEQQVETVASSLTSTSSANASDVTSLVQLLSISPAKIDGNVQLSEDSSVILNAINELSHRITELEAPVQKHESVSLNGCVARRGDSLYKKGGTPIGRLMSFGNKGITVDNDGETQRYTYSEVEEYGICDIPF